MSKYETVDYKVIEKEHDFEIRQYEAFNTVAVDEDRLDSSGFNQIFNYISGNNANHEKIPMTVPVINEMKDGEVSTEFVMPHKYSAETLPKPSNPDLEIRTIQGKLTASVTFSGTVTENKIKRYEKELSEWLTNKNIKSVGNFRLARYNSPFSLPALRRNEILIDIKK